MSPLQSFKDQREIPLAHLRGVLFLLMIFDHTLHGYALNWAPFWFIRDFDRTAVLDGLYLFNQAIIIPGIFFTFGAVVLRDRQELGALAFLKMLLWRYGLPTLLGLLLIVPLLTFPKYISFENPSSNFYTYWRDVWFAGRYQAGPFWVMINLFFLSAVLVLLQQFFPSVLRFFKSLVATFLKTPLAILGFIAFAFIAFFISDLIWGAPWWIGFFKIFSVQGSKFIMNTVFFFLGHGFYQHLKEHPNALNPFFSKTSIWGILVLIFGLAYGIFCVVYFDEGAFRYDLKVYLSKGGALFESWAILKNYVLLIFVRTALLGILVCCQLIFLLLLFYKKGNQPQRYLSPFAHLAWGLFIFHEGFVVWGQYLLTGITLGLYLKIFIIFLISLFLSYILSALLIRFALFERVLRVT